ncbi:MAG: strawberry notch C-terminal domain-containing protein, partial [Bacteroidota bacterium]
MDSATEILRDIMWFQETHVNPAIESLDKIQKAEYKEVETRKGTKNAGIDNMPVFSGIFNIINQLLFSLKAESVAEVAIQRLKEGKKPVIAFANTMESFLNTLTNDDGTAVKDGDIINSDFSMIFQKRLNSVLKYTEKDADGNPEYKMIDIIEQSDDFQAAYKIVLYKIKKQSIGISSSPIDVLTDKIEKAGYSCVEVTGRDKKLKILGENKGMVKARVKLAANDAFRQFNNNEVDCLLINQSGSTGASAHALPNVKTPKDKVKQRVMIILQAELNINTEVQKRGRINRTGQIFKPIYDYVISAIPAEKRLMMMLQKKLKSLDANTTSSQKQSEELMDVRQADFLNKYGDDVVVDYLTENPVVNIQIGDPLHLQDRKEGKEADSQDAAHRVSGRVAVLKCKEQEAFYSEVSQRYISQVEYFKQTGEYDLEVENMNLEAETLEKDIVIMGKGGNSVFGRHSILEKCSINNLKKPFKKSDIDALIKESLGEYQSKELQKIIFEKCRSFFKTNYDEEITENKNYYDNAIKNVPNEKRVLEITDTKQRIAFEKTRIAALETAMEEKAEKIKISSENKFKLIGGIIQFFHVGRVIGYPSVTYSQNGDYYKGIFLGFDIKDNAKNPYAPSAMRLRFAIAGSLKYIALPASKMEIINTIKDISYSNIDSSEQVSVLLEWDEMISSKTKDKVTRYIVTGNILQAFGKAELKGSLISYTTSDGGIKKGILLPDSFSKDSKTNKSGTTGGYGAALTITVPIINALPVIKSMVVNKSIATNDGFSFFRRTDDFRISVSASKQKGGKIYLNETIKKITTEKTFNKTGDQMVATIELRKIDNLIEFLQLEFNMSIELTQQQFEQIKGNIVIDDYKDEIKVPEPIVFVEKLSDIKETTETKRDSGKEELKFPKIPERVKMFMPTFQQKIVNSNIAEFQDAIENLDSAISKMPYTYQTEGQGNKAIVYLHYFYGSSDWYITEKDKETEQLQAFGLADMGFPEMGYINIEEIKSMGKVELDFYWKPKTLAEVNGEDEDIIEEEEPELTRPEKCDTFTSDFNKLYGKGVLQIGSIIKISNIPYHVKKILPDAIEFDIKDGKRNDPQHKEYDYEELNSLFDTNRLSFDTYSNESETDKILFKEMLATVRYCEMFNKGNIDVYDRDTKIRE